MSAYTAIASQTLTSAASSVTFSSIPQDFRDLVLVFDGQSTSNAEIRARLNSDSAGNYNFVFMHATNAGVGSSAASNLTFLFPASSGIVANNKATLTLEFMDYTQTNKHKSILARFNHLEIQNNRAASLAHRWANTAALTTIFIEISAGNFAIGSTFSLYGVSA